MKLNLKDIHELETLHKALIEAKFPNGEPNTSLSASSILSKICNEVLDNIIDYYKQIGNESRVSSWQNWRLLHQDRREYKMIDSLIRKNPQLKDLDSQLLDEHLQSLVSPFRIEKELYQTFLDSIRKNDELD